MFVPGAFPGKSTEEGGRWRDLDTRRTFVPVARDREDGDKEDEDGEIERKAYKKWIFTEVSEIKRGA